MDNEIATSKLLEQFSVHPDVFKTLPIPGAIFSSDFPTLTIIGVNEAFSVLVEVSENELTGRGFFDAFARMTDLDSRDWANLIEQAIFENRTVSLPVMKFNGNSSGDRLVSARMYLLGAITPLNEAGETLSQVVCTFTDVTALVSREQHEKDTTAARNAKLLEETQRIAKIGSWEADLTKNTIVWSDLTKEIYEVEIDFVPSFDDVIGFINNEQEKQTFVGIVEEAMKSSQMFDADVQIITARGNKRTIRITGQPGYTAGYCDKISGVIQDISEKTNAARSLIESRKQMQSLIQSVNGIFWEADALAFEFSFVSDHAKSILGYSPEEWLRERYFWESHIHPADLQHAVNFCQIQVKKLKDHTLDYRMIRADGNVIWIRDVVSVIIENGKAISLRGLMLDITETKRIEEVGLLEKTVLELNTTNDANLSELLIMYLAGIEAIYPGMQCSMHEVKENRLDQAFAPTIPAAYLRQLFKLPIGPHTGSCGSAAFLKERVVVADIAQDPRWTDYKELALKYNLLSCWSQPIINSEGVVVATLGFYYNKVKLPDEGELSLMERCVAILKVILENRQKSILLEESTLLMKQGQELAGFGNWQWDILNNIVRWSDELYAIYGLNKTSFKATFEGYQELLHPDDRERVRNTIQEVVQNKTDIVFEERIVRPDGEIRHLKSWGRLQTDEKGVAVKMIGACLDITESRRYTKAIEQQNEKLQSIAFMQSHVVRAPLARLMGTVDLMKNYTNTEQENEQLLDYILASAQELDDVIKDISDKAK